MLILIKEFKIIMVKYKRKYCFLNNFIINSTNPSQNCSKPVILQTNINIVIYNKKHLYMNKNKVKKYFNALIFKERYEKQFDRI